MARRLTWLGESGGLRVAIEVETDRVDRVGFGIQKAAAISATFLLFVTPTRRTAAAVNRRLVKEIEQICRDPRDGNDPILSWVLTSSSRGAIASQPLGRALSTLANYFPHPNQKARNKEIKK